MINIKFWNFSKRDNSTKQPSSTGAQTYACALKEGCSVLSPEIILTLPATTNPSSYTYAQIADFNRYYFVSGWTYNRGEWIASLKVDTLATYKSEIGNLSKYVLRSASSYDGDITDTLFPAKSGRLQLSEGAASPFEGTPCVVVGIVGKGGQFGGLNYYSMTEYESYQFFQWLMGTPDSEDVEDNFTQFVLDILGVVDQIEKERIDPMQYIKSVMWFPVTISGTSTIVTTGKYTLLQSARLIPTYGFWNTQVSVAVPKHPQAYARGNYCNDAPYSDYTLVFPPFPDIPLDAKLMKNASAVSMDIWLDPITGDGTMIVKASGNLVTIVHAQVGVPLAINSASRDIIGNTINAIPQVVGSIATENYLGAVAGIFNAVTNSTPKVQSSGNNGSTIPYLIGNPVVINNYSTIVSNDLDDQGAPLCQIKKINTLSGYILCADGEVPISAYESERTQISSYLTGGFFYE